MSHWSDEQFAAAALGQSAGHETHLADCAACRGELERLRKELNTLRQDAAAAAAQTEKFWQRQRAAIRAQLAGGATVTRGWAWAAAAVAVLLLAVLFGRTTLPPPDVARNGKDPDHLLMLEVQQALERRLPRALAPAALLTEEISRAAQEERNP
jgi:predicted anti-sigma-YlaC factor YlaD